MNSLDFTVWVQYRFLKANHMNFNEHRVYRTLVKLLAKSYPGCRVSYFGDSMVSGSVAAKGRSGSQPLNRLQAICILYLLGSGLRLAPLWVATDDNPADDPTRDRPLRPPPRGLPAWWAALLVDDFLPFDSAVEDSKLSAPLCCWRRVVRWVMSKVFDHMLGYPREGPQRRASTARLADFEQPRLSVEGLRRRTRATNRGCCCCSPRSSHGRRCCSPAPCERTTAVSSRTAGPTTLSWRPLWEYAIVIVTFVMSSR